MKYIKDRNNRTQYIVKEQGNEVVYCTPENRRIGSLRNGKTWDANYRILADTERPELILMQLPNLR